MSPSDPVFHVQLQFVSVLASFLFRRYLATFVFRRNCVRAPFANAHKLFIIYGFSGTKGFLEVWNKLRLSALM